MKGATHRVVFNWFDKWWRYDLVVLMPDGAHKLVTANRLENVGHDALAKDVLAAIGGQVRLIASSVKTAQIESQDGVFTAWLKVPPA